MYLKSKINHLRDIELDQYLTIELTFPSKLGRLVSVLMGVEVPDDGEGEGRMS